MTNETLITQEGLQKLKDELNELKSVRRIEISQRIKEAIALGDLSENAEYDAMQKGDINHMPKAVLPNWKPRSARLRSSWKPMMARIKSASVPKSSWKMPKRGTASITPSSVRQKPIRSTAAFPMNLL